MAYNGLKNTPTTPCKYQVPTCILFQPLSPPPPRNAPLVHLYLGGGGVPTQEVDPPVLASRLDNLPQNHGRQSITISL